MQSGAAGRPAQVASVASATTKSSAAASAASTPVSAASSPSCASPLVLSSDCEQSLPWQWPADVVAKSPSVEDGMTHAEVLERKHLAFVFIEEMRKELKFPVIISSTAMVLFNRFYHYQSMKQFKWKDMAWCCLFAAGKICEKVMKMESFLKWSHYISCKLKKMSREDMDRNKLDVNGREFFEMKERLQFNERVLLQTIGFEMDIKQVGFMVVALLRTLKQRAPSYTQAWAKEVGKVAFEWASCSAGSELCLLYKPEVIAAGLIYGAAHDTFGKLEHPANGDKMWNLFYPLIPQGDVTESILHAIMTSFYAYCTRFREPRAFWRAKSAAAAGAPADAKIKVIGPPKDPAAYDPIRVAVAAAAAAGSGGGAAVGTTGVVVGAPGVGVGVGGGTATVGVSPVAPAVSAPVAGLAAPPTTTTATPSSMPVAAGAGMPAATPMDTTKSPSGALGAVAASSASGSATAHPTPPRTADNTPHGSQASSPGEPVSMAAVATGTAPSHGAGGVVANDHAHAHGRPSMHVTPLAVAQTVGSTPAARPEKRLMSEVVPPGGGDGSMKDETVSWDVHVPPPAKRIRDGV